MFSQETQREQVIYAYGIRATAMVLGAFRYTVNRWHKAYALYGREELRPKLTALRHRKTVVIPSVT